MLGFKFFVCLKAIIKVKQRGLFSLRMQEDRRVPVFFHIFTLYTVSAADPGAAET